MSASIALLTEDRYEDPAPGHWYTDNILEDDRLLIEALVARGLAPRRVSWSRAGVDWSSFDAAVFRTTWDYFDRFAEFCAWLERVEEQTRLHNPAPQVRWNADKHYLGELEARGVHTVPTVFIERGAAADLETLMREHGHEQAVLKPAVSGAGRDTYRLRRGHAGEHQPRLEALLRGESMMLQPFQRDILERGERTLVVIDGRFTHAVRKVARPGEFRVQDDHGGTVHPYRPEPDEIAFAERAMAACDPLPLYGRVDMIRDNDGALAVMELELIEPELWLRMCPEAASRIAEGLIRRLNDVTP